MASSSPLADSVDSRKQSSGDFGVGVVDREDPRLSRENSLQVEGERRRSVSPGVRLPPLSVSVVSGGGGGGDKVIID